MRIAIIGCGNLGASLARGLLNSGDLESVLRLCDRDPSRLEQLISEFSPRDLFTTPDPREAAQGADVVIVAVKPKDLEETFAELGGSLAPNSLIVSCAAGIAVEDLENFIGRPFAIARAMPNIAIGLSAGTTGVFLGPNCDLERDLEKIVSIFGLVSDVGLVEDEEALHSVTALTGSGPAFVMTMLEAMIEAGVRSGLSREQAEFFAKGAFKAAHHLVEKSEVSVSELRASITSPAGTTAEGLFALEEGSFRATVMNAVKEAANRSEEIAMEMTFE